MTEALLEKVHSDHEEVSTKIHVVEKGLGSLLKKVTTEYELDEEKYSKYIKDFPASSAKSYSTL